MIDGITILNKIEATEEPGWIMLMFVVMIMVFMACLTIMIATEYEAVGVIGMGVSITGLLIVLIIGLIIPPEKTGRYQYEVIIEDNVSLTEVYEYYDVIEHRGDIWILEDLGQH